MSVMSQDLRLEHPFTCIISGPSGSGKSSFLIQLLQNLESLCTEPNFDCGFLSCYGEKNAVPSQQLASADFGKRIQFHGSVPENFTIAGSRRCLIILDDLLNNVYSKEVCQLFTKGSHHRNTSVILITHNLFHQERYCRVISLNAKYLVLLKNVTDKNEFTIWHAKCIPKTVVVCTGRIWMRRENPTLISC